MEAPRDQNQVPTILGTDSSDGFTPIPVKIDPSSHSLKVMDGITGSDLSGDVAARDNNQVPVMMGTSEVDGKTPVPIYTDQATGSLLIDSN